MTKFGVHGLWNKWIIFTLSCINCACRGPWVVFRMSWWSSGAGLHMAKCHQNWDGQTTMALLSPRQSLEFLHMGKMWKTQVAMQLPVPICNNNNAQYMERAIPDGFKIWVTLHQKRQRNHASIYYVFAEEQAVSHVGDHRWWQECTLSQMGLLQLEADGVLNTTRVWLAIFSVRIWAEAPQGFPYRSLQLGCRR